MLFFVFTVEAQNNETRKKSDNRKATNTSVKKSAGKSSSSKTKATKTSSSSSRSNAAKSSNSSSRSSVNKNTNNSSRSNASKSSSSRSRSSATAPARTAPPSRTKSDDINAKRPGRSNTQSTRTTTTTTTRTRTTGNSGSSASPTRATPPDRTRSNDIDARKAGASRTVDASNSRNRNSNNGSRVVDAQRSRSANSVRGSGYTPKTSVRNAENRKVYTTSRTHRVTRSAPKVHYTYHPIEYRRVHTPYRAPRTQIIYWNTHMHREYRSWYSDYNLWYYPYGYKIHTISAYDAIAYVGEIARVYGEVSEVYYSRETRQYYLYVGGPHPYNDFTVILDSRDARRFSFDPIRFFTNRHISVTGLISTFDGKPEILVKKRKQVNVY